MAKNEEPKPKKFTFRGAQITGYDFRVPEKGGGSFLKIHFRADFTDTVCEQMGWLPLADTYKKGTIKQTLHAVTMGVKPSDKELDKYAFDFVAKELGSGTGFSVESLKKGENSPDECIVSFSATTTAQGIVGKVHSWCSRIGRELCQLKGEYIEKLEPEEEDDGQLELMEDDATEAGTEIPPDVGASTLASRQQVEGRNKKKDAKDVQ